MKKIYLICLILLTSLTIFAQNIEGSYRDGNDLLKFEGTRILFNMEEVGGLSNHIGNGTYRQINNYIIVDTDEYNGEKTIVERLPQSRKDTISVTIADYHNNPLSGVLVESLSESGKLIMSATTRNDGRLLFLPNAKMKKFRIFEMGFDDIEFDIQPNEDYHVKMSDQKSVENKTVVFRLREIDEETIGVMLLSTDFKQGKDLQKSLDKLYQSALKKNFLEKRMKK
jgi:hypothetical protein